jgi:DUF4097 and DUF4098 domain-containing protein YvlB
MRRSITGPLMLLLIGGLFLWRNLHPETPVFEILARYWPFLLILWGVMRLIESMFQPRGTARGFSGGEVCLIIFICIFGMGMWGARNFPLRISTGGLQWFGEGYDYQISGNAPSDGIKRIVFDNPRGSVKVNGGDSQQITVTGHKTVRAYSHQDAENTNQNTPLEIITQGDRLLVRTNQDRAPDSQRISDDLEVTVPRGVAVEAHVTSGDYDISDVQGDVELANGRGDIRLARIGGNAHLDISRSNTITANEVKGKIELEGRGDDIDFEDIGGEVTVKGAYTRVEFKKLAKQVQFEGARNTELRLAAVPGELTMDLQSLTATGITGPVHFVAKSRDMKIEQFTQSMQLETDRGDIELRPGTRSLAGIEVRTGNGAIELALPANAAFQLQATAERGEAENDYGSPVTRDQDGRSVTLRSPGPGPQITATANHGRISVRKDDEAASAPAGKQPKDSGAKDLKNSEVKM